MITDQIRSTVYLIDPTQEAVRRLGYGHATSMSACLDSRLGMSQTG
jgi:hypothetical protein